ncbi:hypothetical protein WDU94_005047 [Cyamophila willieti]
MKQYIVTLDPPLIPFTLLPDEGTKTLITKKTILGRRYKNPEYGAKKEEKAAAVGNINSRTCLRVIPQNRNGTTKGKKRSSTRRHKRSHSILRSKQICRKLVESNQTRGQRLRSRRPYKSRFDRIRSVTKRKAENGGQKMGTHHQKDEEGTKAKVIKIDRIQTAETKHRRDRISPKKSDIKPQDKLNVQTGTDDRGMHESGGKEWKDKDIQFNSEQRNNRKQSETEEKGRSTEITHKTNIRIQSSNTEYKGGKQTTETGRGNERNTDLELWLRRIKSGILDTNERLFGCNTTNKTNAITRRRVKKRLREEE